MEILCHETWALSRVSAGLSFRTGVAVACCCLLCYSLSFGQMLLPVSAETKVILWTILFGLAKALQYSALLILGKTGVQKLKKRIRRNQ